jgi:hypothetical protein
MAFRKIEAGLVQSSVGNFIGKKGTIFYDNDNGVLRLSNGVTPGGVIITINPRVTNITSSSTITPTSNIADQYGVTALAVSATIAIPSGTPVDGQKLVLRIKDDGTARALTWTTSGVNSYRVVGTTLPTTTVINKLLYVGCIYNATESFWDVIAVAQQA